MPNSKSDFLSVELNPQARLRLFCFPYAGSGAASFYQWSKELPPEIQVCPIQLPGRESRLAVTPYTRLFPLVKELAQALIPYMDVPFAFFGHSMGSMIGFELARELRRRDECGPRHLFISACRAPQIPDPARPLHQLSESQFVREFSQRYNSIPPVVLQNDELLKLFLPVLKADMAIVETYVYMDEEPLACPISAFGGLSDPEATRDDLEAWRALTRGAFTLRMLEGDHFFLSSNRSVILQAVCEDLMQQL
jgi:medium-chain acyl-[acyl-carrier-protein] hydrolase